MNFTERQRGAVNPLLFASILLAFLAVVLAGFGVWAFSGYTDYKNNVDVKIEKAVADSQAATKVELEKQFVEREKQPYRQFTGPDDLGHVTFDYPKTWSGYVGKASTSSYEAYFYPLIVPTVATSQPYAVRVTIDDQEYTKSLQSYEAAVKKGTLKSTPLTVNGATGIRLDGVFTKERTGSAVVFKVRDKTLTIASDATEFKNDFDNVVIKSLDFNP